MNFTSVFLVIFTFSSIALERALLQSIALVRNFEIVYHEWSFYRHNLIYDQIEKIGRTWWLPGLAAVSALGVWKVEWATWRHLPDLPVCLCPRRLLLGLSKGPCLREGHSRHPWAALGIHGDKKPVCFHENCEPEDGPAKRTARLVPRAHHCNGEAAHFFVA